MSRSKGNIAENKACEFLNSQSFKILEQNFYAKKLGEIDIICKKDETYHFIEVKSAETYEIAVNNITPSKLSKLKEVLITTYKAKNYMLVFVLMQL